MVQNHAINSGKFLYKLKEYALLVRLNRPIGAFLLLWPMLWALWIAADGRPNARVLWVFVAGVILMRSAGCAMNDFADRDIDPKVARTRDRPLARSAISPPEALAVAGLLSLIAFGLVWLTNTLTVWMSVVGALLAASYPFMKRVHSLPQVHLGAAFGWAVPMAFTAQTGMPPTATGWLIFIAAVLWATVYDTQYAMADRADDVKVGVKSTAILFGDADRAIIGIIQIVLLLDLIVIGQWAGLGIYYYLGLGVAAALAIYQQLLIANREPQRCFRAFLNNNYFGLAVFAGIALDYRLT
ncbi:MAG TPA: 4-hydroxybenzoate octaprenyltransferase [Gammaproteobacteria bacterium]|jgi:4-hydroxybenzoate polyprenyltransferase|nr:4-hydroxybenzoate octaprenyltransferase [Gammaproteobacteria bacterium]